MKFQQLVGRGEVVCAESEVAVTVAVVEAGGVVGSGVQEQESKSGVVGPLTQMAHLEHTEMWTVVNFSVLLSAPSTQMTS